MEVSDLILADYATANQRGKFTLVGAGINEITAKRVPCVHSLMFLLVRLKVTRQDIGGNKITIQLVSEKGVIFKAECDLNVSSDHKDEEHVPLPIQLVNLKFDSFGDYNIEVRINGELKQSQNLRIRQLESQSVK